MKKEKVFDGMIGKSIQTCGGKRFRRELDDIFNTQMDGNVEGLIKSSGQCCVLPALPLE